MVAAMHVLDAAVLAVVRKLAAASVRVMVAWALMVVRRRMLKPPQQAAATGAATMAQLPMLMAAASHRWR